MADNNRNPKIDLEHLWEFKGQGLRSSDFTSAMIHFYRGEITRSNTWRIRLDNTTNWAVVTTGASLTFVFGGINNSPAILLVNTFLILLFLFMEARRYRYYELWASRVRIMEKNFFTGLLSPPFMPHTGWAEEIKESLNNPRFPITLLEAMGRRYRRNYALIFLIIAISWIGKVYIHPTTALTFDEFLTRAAMGAIPGWFVIMMGVLFNTSLLALGLFTVGMQDTTSEVVATSGRINKISKRLRRVAWEAADIDIPSIKQYSTRKQLVLIISDEDEAVSEAIIKTLGRGVTRMHGTGMYTHEDHGVLLCVVEERQMAELQRVVLMVDAEAFVIVTGTTDVRGAGFRPLEA